MKDKSEILVICGATASGKSDAAVKIAELLDGEIVGADSMQIYRGLNIGTAKITESEMRGVKHHMIDIIDPKDSYSVSDYVGDAVKAIDSIMNIGKTPIVVGGTGLYIDGILYENEYGKCGSDDMLRETLSRKYELDGGEKLYNEMLALDPVDTARYHKNNKRRLLRAWEIYLLGGKTKSELAKERRHRYNADIIVVDRERDILYHRIDLRVDKMFSCGIEGEIRRLLEYGVNFKNQSMQAIGYKEFEPYFNGECGIEDVKAAIKLNTRHYAKRQITWFKQYKNAIRLEPSTAVEAAAKIYK